MADFNYLLVRLPLGSSEPGGFRVLVALWLLRGAARSIGYPLQWTVERTEEARHAR